MPGMPISSARPVAGRSSWPIRRSIWEPGSEGRAGPGRGHLHMPNASADPPDRARQLPHLRNGARAGDRHGRHRAERRACRHDAPVLDRPRAQPAGFGSRNGRPSHEPPYASRRSDLQLDPACAGNAGRIVGRRTLLPARLCVARYAKSQHVHADRDGDGRRLGLQRRRYVGSGHFSRNLSRA